MKERLANLVSPEKAKTVTLGTFHSFCIKILRREIKAIGYMSNFTIADESDQAGLIKQAAAAVGYGKNDVPVPEISVYISGQKNRLRFPRDAKRTADNDYQIRMSVIYEEYQQLLEIQNMLDFDDMLLLTYELWEKHPEILKKYQDIYQYLLVDEYQDTNDAQFTLIKMLCGKHCNLCVVGDDDQSIYGWRGANIGNILEFPSMFPGTVQIKLEQNYRSTSKILSVANLVISGNSNRYTKNLWSALGEGDNIKLVKANCAEAESDFIAGYILQEVAENPELSYGDFAILYRSNHLSRQLEQSMRQYSVPYKLIGGQEFFKRKEIKDAVTYLKLLVNPREDQGLLRILTVPPRGLAQKAVDRLKELKALKFTPFCESLGEEDFLQSMPAAAAASARELSNCFKQYTKVFSEPGDLAAKVNRYLQDVGYLGGLQKIYKDIEDSLKRRDNIDEFINAIAQFEAKREKPPTLEEYLESYALLEENDKVEDKSDDGNSVTLTTIHAAKGLEFPYVFVIALEKNIFPHERAIMEGSIDEELRLFYVALTRAQKNLLLTYTVARMYRGFERNQIPSPFISLLPEQIVDSNLPEELIKTMDNDSLNREFENIFALLKS